METIELRKETDIDGIWYCIYINNIWKRATRDGNEANTLFNTVVNNAKNIPSIEVLKSETI